VLRGLLFGRKVLVRPFCPADITLTYVGWLSDPAVVRYSNQRFRRHTIESCQQYLASFRDSDNHFLAICNPHSMTMLGTLTVYRNVPHRTADIGIMVGDPASWGKGIGLDAFRTVAEALERSGEIRKITAGTLAINTGMIRIMEKSGMEKEATRSGHELVDGQPVDVVYYAKFCNACSE
jgi:RimJ/RimL family protein N-acetyltransferase